MSTTINKRKPVVAPVAASPRFILLDSPAKWSDEFLKKHCVACRSPAQMNNAARLANRDSLWIASRSKTIDCLIRAVAEFLVARAGRETCLGNLLMLNPPRARALAILNGLFESVVGADSAFKTLPPDQLAEVLSAPKERARDLFIGGLVDPQSKTLALVRGDLSRLVVPFSIFRASGNAKPDFGRFDVDDYGQTIRLGNYEAGADFVLYALDPGFRARSNAWRRKHEHGLGPSLRRLRILRKLGRNNFEGIAPKTIARIERGEVQKPRPRTLQAICRVLGVDAEEIETY